MKMETSGGRFGRSSLGDFVDLNEIHRSSDRNGIVYIAKFKSDGKSYCLKERKASELGKNKGIFLHEASLLSQLSHKNIVKCLGWFNDEDRKSTTIVIEYCNRGDLHAFIHDRKRRRDLHPYFREDTIWYLYHQICAGVYHLHEHGIVHRDLKPLNILLCDDPSSGIIIKIADLGVSRQVSNDTMMLETFYGTPLYLSAELVQGKAYNEKTDIWSLGVILYELCYLKTPFQGRSIMELANSIIIGEYNIKPSCISYSDGITACIRSMLVPDMHLRPSISRLIRSIHSHNIAYCPAIASDINISDKTVTDDKHESDTEDEDDKINHTSSPPHIIQHPSKVMLQPMQHVTNTPIISVDNNNGSISKHKIVILNASKDHHAKPPLNIKGDDNTITVDISKLHVCLRREQAKLQRLRYTNDYLHTSAKAIDIEDDNIRSDIHHIEHRIEVLEKVLSSGFVEIEHNDAVRIDLEAILSCDNATSSPRISTASSHIHVHEVSDALSSNRSVQRHRQTVSIDPGQQRRDHHNLISKASHVSSAYALDSMNTRRSSSSNRQTASSNDRLFLNTRSSQRDGSETANSEQTSRRVPSFAMAGNKKLHK